MSKHPATCDYTRIRRLKWCCDHFISFYIYFCDFATKYVNVLISTIHIHIIDNLFYSNGKPEFKTPILLNYLSLFRHSWWPRLPHCKREIVWALQVECCQCLHPPFVARVTELRLVFADEGAHAGFTALLVGQHLVYHTGHVGRGDLYRGEADPQGQIYVPRTLVILRGPGPAMTQWCWIGELIILHVWGPKRKLTPFWPVFKPFFGISPEIFAMVQKAAILHFRNSSIIVPLGK